MKRTLWLCAAILILAISLPLLVWGFWPPRRETRVVALIPAGEGLSLSEARRIRLEFSPSLRFGDSGVIRMWLEPGETYQLDPLYEAYTVIAEARLELPFADARPTDLVSTPLSAGDTASFYWEVTPREPQTLRGTVWLYLRFVSKEGGAETRVAVSAQEVAIRSESMWKRTGSEARAVGVVGALVGLTLAIPFIKRRGSNAI
jgi:hypothetical protein